MRSRLAIVTLFLVAALAGCKRGNTADYYNSGPTVGPDLMLSDVTLSATPMRAGQRIRITTTIKNVGSLNAVGPFSIVVRWTNGSEVYDEIKWYEGTLGAGLTTNIFWDVQPRVAGTLEMQGRIDDNLTVSEEREFNNDISERFVVASSG